MKTVDVSVCEKCGYFSLDSEKVREHEKIRTKGVVHSLDGLIVRGYGANIEYLVFTRMPFLSGAHEALYNWRNFDGNLRDSGRNMPGRLKQGRVDFLNLRTGDIQTGHTSSYIFNVVMGLESRSESNLFRLSDDNFEDISGRLRKIYPKIFENVEFKQDCYKAKLKAPLNSH